MRLEDLLVDRGEPHSRFVDLRPESKRHTMAMSASDSREVLACDDLPPDLSKHDLVIALDEQLEDLATSLADVPRETWPDLAVILPGAPGRANVPEVLDWATRNDWQLVDLSPVRLPQCVCALLTGRNHAVPPSRCGPLNRPARDCGNGSSGNCCSNACARRRGRNGRWPPRLPGGIYPRRRPVPANCWKRPTLESSAGRRN